MAGDGCACAVATEVAESSPVSLDAHSADPSVSSPTVMLGMCMSKAWPAFCVVERRSQPVHLIGESG